MLLRERGRKENGVAHAAGTRFNARNVAPMATKAFSGELLCEFVYSFVERDAASACFLIILGRCVGRKEGGYFLRCAYVDVRVSRETRYRASLIFEV